MKKDAQHEHSKHHKFTSHRKQAPNISHPFPQNASSFIHLHNKVGNQAIQCLLATESGQIPPLQCQTDEDSSHSASALALDDQQNEQNEDSIAEVGEIIINKAEIDYYDVNDSDFESAKQTVEGERDWCEYEYKYDVKAENNLVNEVNVEVNIKLRLPQWSGQEWLGADIGDKISWLNLIQAYGVTDQDVQEQTELPPEWLLGPDWEDAPQPFKNNWLTVLQEIQKNEQGYIEVARRRATVLQQRLFNQPESEISNVFDKFLEDVTTEQDVYDEGYEIGEKLNVSLNTNTLLQ